MDAASTSLFQQAEQAAQNGQFAEAKRILTELTAKDAKIADAWFLLALMNAELGDLEAAISQLNQSLFLHSANEWALFHLIRIYRIQGNIDLACKTAERMSRLRNADPGVFMEAGMAFADGKLFGMAADCFQIAAQVPELNTAANFWRAVALKEIGRMTEVRKLLQQVAPVAKAPEPYFRLAEVEIFFGNTEAAKRAAANAVRLEPRFAAAHEIAARALSVEGDLEGAAKEWDLAESASATPDQMMTSRGYILQSQGNFADAEASFKKAIHTNPKDGNPYALLFHTRKVSENDAELMQLAEKQLAEGVDPTSQRHLHYALGKGFHDLKKYEEANAHYEAANALSAEVLFNNQLVSDNQANYHDGIMKVLTKDSLKQLAKKGNPSERPVFIIGMIRSGTTLMEQILTSHPDVQGAGELGFWQVNRYAFVDFERMKVLDELLARGAAEYLELLANLKQDSARVTDKNPVNYSSAGLIHAAFPNARIICMRRQPIDIALSIWMTNMNTLAPFVGKKASIVHAIQEMLRITDYWKTVIPEDRFTIVNYEDVVADREGQTRRLIDFLGLPWDDRCLEHTANQRDVLTPSFWQVRQPVYTSSIDRWRPYEKWLGEFRELLPS